MCSPRSFSSVQLISACSFIAAWLGIIAVVIDKLQAEPYGDLCDQTRRSIPLPGDLIYGFPEHGSFTSTVTGLRCRDFSLSVGMVFGNIFAFILFGAAAGAITRFGLFAANGCRARVVAAAANVVMDDVDESLLTDSSADNEVDGLSDHDVSEDDNNNELEEERIGLPGINP